MSSLLRMQCHVLSILAGVLLASACGSSSSSSGNTPVCSVSSSCPGGGASVQACITKDANGACASTYFQVGDATFSCASCTDVTKCTNDAVQACGSVGADEGGVEGDAGNAGYPTSYPYTNPGMQARVGSAPGQQIENFSFNGYFNADITKQTDPSQGLAKIALANFYDPHQTRFKVIQLIVVSMYAAPCGLETDDIVSAASSLAAAGVVSVEIVWDGPTAGTSATTSDLTAWIGTHKIDFTVAFDPSQQLGPFLDASAVPATIYLDARTMEILADGVGYSSGNITPQAKTWVDWVNTNPPSY